MYLKILLLGWFLIILQGFTSFCDGYLYQAQMNRLGIYGWAFMEHGGMWADFFIVSPVVAFIVSKYQLPYLSTRSWIIIGIIIVVTIIAGCQYRQMAMATPEAHTHNGYTTAAGWIHGLYALISAWIIVLLFVSPLSLHIEKNHLIMIATLLSFWATMGVMKFNPKWMWNSSLIMQVATEIAAIWAIIVARVFFQH